MYRPLYDQIPGPGREDDRQDGAAQSLGKHDAHEPGHDQEGGDEQVNDSSHSRIPSASRSSAVSFSAMARF